MDYTRKMLSKIRNTISEQYKVELPGQKIISEEEGKAKKKLINEENNPQQPQGEPFVIKSSDVQFGSVKSSQEDAIRKTIGDVTLKDDALKYYKDIDDLVLNGEVTGLGITFQFRYKDKSGDGCYIWSEGSQLTDSNLTAIEKIRDAFMNWKQSIAEDGDLLNKLHKEASKND